MTNPTLITTPFAENGDKNIIPESTGAQPQNATMQAGFPPITQQKISEGGIPPERNDFNGILNLYGQHLVHLNKGLLYEFDQNFADSIGGYPLNSILMLANGNIVKSIVANNTTNPNASMTGWVKVNSASQIFDEDGRSQQEINNSLPTMTGKFKQDGSDESDTIQAYLFAASQLGRQFIFPKGIITFSKTIDITFQTSFAGGGAGRDSTILQFNNNNQDTPAFRFKRGSAKSLVSNLTIRNFYFGKSIGIQFTDSRLETGTPVWKNLFTNVELSGHGIAIHFTSANPLNGSDHAHCSENLFLDCKLSVNSVAVKNQNCQAVNNLFTRFDIENTSMTWIDGTNVVDNFDMIQDYAGGGMSFVDCSLIGHGRWYTWAYPSGGTTLFAGSAYLNIIRPTGEARHDPAIGSPHYGALIEEGVSGVTGTLGMKINVSDCGVALYGNSVDLIRFGGRVIANFNNCYPKLGTGRLYVRFYPTLGRSSGASTGSQATIICDSCENTFYEKEATSPYGTYSLLSTCNVFFYNQHSGSTNSSFSTDSDGWINLNYGGDVKQLPYTVGSFGGFSNIVYNNDSLGSGLAANAQIKVSMPKYGRPLKLWTYKHPLRMTTETQFNLYLVKDKANWATPGTFNKATDALLVSTTPSSINKCGYFESPVVLLSNLLGTQLQSGFGSWLEGKMLIEYVGSISYAGFVGVGYV